MSEGEKAEETEADRVEESLRDFIGRIIRYYDRFKVQEGLLARFEGRISGAETLLEVFEVMKDMFDTLMMSVERTTV